MISWLWGIFFGCFHTWKCRHSDRGTIVRKLDNSPVGQYAYSHMQCEKCGQWKVVKSTAQ